MTRAGGTRRWPVAHCGCVGDPQTQGARRTRARQRPQAIVQPQEITHGRVSAPARSGLVPTRSRIARRHVSQYAIGAFVRCPSVHAGARVQATPRPLVRRRSRIVGAPLDQQQAPEVRIRVHRGCGSASYAHRRISSVSIHVARRSRMKGQGSNGADLRFSGSSAPASPSAAAIPAAAPALPSLAPRANARQAPGFAVGRASRSPTAARFNASLHLDASSVEPDVTRRRLRRPASAGRACPDQAAWSP